MPWPVASRRTEVPEACRNDPRLAAPLLAEPFTHGKIGVLMRKWQDDLLAFVNAALAEMAADGTLDSLKAKHGLSTYSVSHCDIIPESD